MIYGLWPFTLYTANVVAILGYQNSLFPRDPWALNSANKEEENTNVAILWSSQGQSRFPTWKEAH